MTQTEGKRLIEAYRLALCHGEVARYRGRFRNGDIVRFCIDDESGFSDGLSTEFRMALAGEYQLHYAGPGSYGVFGRIADSKNEWVLVDGKWAIGSGPFDNTRTGRSI